MFMSLIMGLLSLFGISTDDTKVNGDHMSLQGGMTVVNNVKPFYVEHLSMINSL